MTNQVYVANNCGDDLSCSSFGTVTHIDSATLGTDEIDVGAFPYGLAVDAVTNQIYVADNCGNDLSCSSAGTVTVIDGATDNSGYIDTDVGPDFVAVDAARNQIYVPNYCGTDLSCNSPGTVTVIDGNTLDTVSVPVGYYPDTLAVNAVTDNAYIVNTADDTVSVIAGVNSPTALQFVAVTPCRVVDTRNANGTFGGPPISGLTSRNFPIPQGACGIPNSAVAYSVNVTMVPISGRPVGYLTIWPTGEDQPVVSTMNSLDGRIKANAAIVPGGYQDAVSVYLSNASNVVIDIDGYFTVPNGQSLQFYTLTPCRVFDTRNADGDLGGPELSGGVARSFPLLESSCIPSGVNSAGVLHELHGHAERRTAYGIPDRLANRRQPAAGFYPEQSDQHRGRERGHRSRRYRRGHFSLCRREHPTGGRYQRLFRRSRVGRPLAVHGSALPRD